MTRSVICISRAAAAGGETIGRMVAEQLGFRYIDEEIIVMASGKAHIDPNLVAKTEERATFLARLLDALAIGPPGELVGAGGPYYLPGVNPVAAPVAEDLRGLIREAIAEIAAQGKVVIVAHAASYALGAGAKVLRVLVTASPETRARRISLLDSGDAAKAVRESDKDRAHYLRTFYDVREETPLHYDVVLNTDALNADQAVAAILAAAR